MRKKLILLIATHFFGFMAGWFLAKNNGGLLMMAIAAAGAIALFIVIAMEVSARRPKGNPNKVDAFVVSTKVEPLPPNRQLGKQQPFQVVDGRKNKK